MKLTVIKTVDFILFSFLHYTLAWKEVQIAVGPSEAEQTQCLLQGCNVMTPEKSSFILYPNRMRILRKETMKVKINEDWLATIIAFALLLLAMANVINPAWVKF